LDVLTPVLQIKPPHSIPPLKLRGDEGGLLYLKRGVRGGKRDIPPTRKMEEQLLIMM